MPDILRPFTYAVGFGSVFMGIYSFIDPVKAARIHGVPLAPTDSTSPTFAGLHFIGQGARTLTLGLAVMALTWQSTVGNEVLRSSVGEASGVRKALGVVLLLGAIPTTTDTLLTYQRSKTEDGKESTTAAIGHALRTFVWAGTGWAWLDM